MVVFADQSGIVTFWATMKRGLSTFLEDLAFAMNSGTWKDFRDFFTPAGEGESKITVRRLEQEKKAADEIKFLTEFEFKTSEQREKILTEEINKLTELQLKDKKIIEERKANYDELSVQELRDINVQRTNLKKDIDERALIIKKLGQVQVRIDEQSKLPKTDAFLAEKEQKRREAEERKAEAAARKAEALLEKQRRDAEEIIKNTNKLQLAEAELAFTRGAQTVENEIAFENRKLEIITEGFNLRQKLYDSDSADYNALQAEKVEAEISTLEKIRKIQETAARQREKDSKEVLRRRKGRQDVADAEFDLEEQVKINVIRTDPKLSDEQKEDALYRIRQRAFTREIADKQSQLERFTEMDEEYFNRKGEIIDLEKKMIEDQGNHEVEVFERTKKRKEELQDQWIEFAQDSANSLFDIGGQYIERDIDRLERQKDRELEFAGQNAQARGLIEESYQKRIAELKRRGAIFDRVQALFNIAIDTAQAVQKATREFPLTAGQPFAGYAIAQGAVQAALVLAQPLPTYKKGRRGGKEEWALVNEEGPELIGRPGRMRIEADGRLTVTKLKAGEDVHTYHETKKIFERELQTEKIVENRTSKDFMHSLLHGTGVVLGYEAAKQHSTADKNNNIDGRALVQGVVNAIREIPAADVHFDDHGFRKFWRNRHHRIEDMNSRNKIGGEG
jgi:hypothetical protein